jgi:hypothetical protein
MDDHGARFGSIPDSRFDTRSGRLHFYFQFDMLGFWSPGRGNNGWHNAWHNAWHNGWHEAAHRRSDLVGDRRLSLQATHDNNEQAKHHHAYHSDKDADYP